MKNAKVTHRYVTEGGELALFWINPWSGTEEKIAAFWWPTHPVENTKEVEDFFEGVAAKASEYVAQAALKEGEKA